MLFTPSILTLLFGSLLTCGMLLYAASYGVRILRNWDIKSGTEMQLGLERRTYLISTILTYILIFQFFSFFLFIYTADHLHIYFPGAMCAAGSLNVNAWGYPVISLKILNVLLAGLWLIFNFVDNQGYDYPLISKKYWFLLGITPLIIIETIAQGAYFLNLRPEIITSCCGTLFSTTGGGFASDVLSLPLIPVQVAFYGGIAVVLTTGGFFYRTSRGGFVFAIASLFAFLVSMVAFISFISVYVYELPTHHCPFCLLQKEYGYIGYFLYLSLWVGAISGIGVGVLTPFCQVDSLKQRLPAVQQGLALATIISFLLFASFAIYVVLSSNLRIS